MASLVIESDWIVPVESPAIRGGFLAVESGKIIYFGQELPERFRDFPKIHLSGGAILPGLINAHCHLELSDIDRPLEVPSGIDSSGPMVGWLGKLMARRRAISGSGAELAESKRDATIRGIEQAWETGTRLVVDNITAPWSGDWCERTARGFGAGARSDALKALVPEVPIHIKPCIELVDVTELRGEQTWAFAQQAQASIPEADAVCRRPVGLAPHAPYTASKRVVAKAVASACEPQGLVSMHLAESLEELEWTDCRQGAFREWISPWIDSEHALHIGTIDEHLRILAGAHRALIAHGNYLTVRQIDWLEQYRERMAVVYCPRTHQHFRHSKHPSEKLADRNVSVFLGTDSRASNPDLSIFEEWKTACKAFPESGPRYWMAACTTGPSIFLGMEHLAGTMRTGSKSLLTWVPLGESSISSEAELWHSMLSSCGVRPLEVQVSLIETKFV